MSSSIEPVSSLVEFFHDELKYAFTELGVETTEETEAYLVHLLDGFSKPDAQTNADVGFDRPAAMILEEAMMANSERRIEIFRRLGDSSLYSCGFFAEHLSRKTVGTAYYLRMGRTAYQSLSDLMRFKEPGGIFQAIFTELAAKFEHCVHAFQLVGEAGVRPQITQFTKTGWILPE